MAGTYTEVTEVVVPSSAQVGTSVSVQVKIKNTHDEALDIMAGGALEYGVTPYPVIVFTDEETVVAAGETESFAGSFIMPDGNVVVHGKSYYYDEDDEAWYYDDELTASITVTAAPTTSILDSIMPIMIMVMMMGMMMKVIK